MIVKRASQCISPGATVAAHAVHVHRCRQSPWSSAPGHGTCTSCAYTGSRTEASLLNATRSKWARDGMLTGEGHPGNQRQYLPGHASIKRHEKLRAANAKSKSSGVSFAAGWML